MITIAHNFAITLQGILFVLAVIAGIGPQNLNIISHAIKNNHSIIVSLCCFVSDIALIYLGFIGFNTSNSAFIIKIINVLGIIFITWFLLSKIKSLLATRQNYKINNNILNLKQSIFRALALTWLNPLVLIDTIVIVDGNILQHNKADQINFLIGAFIGDFIWIFGLTALVRIFAHKLNRTSIWLCLDLITIIIMLIILYKTILYVAGVN